MNESKVYYDYEILPIIQGLDNFYLNKPWYLRWVYRPWHDALTILAIQLCGDLLLDAQDKQDAIDFAEDLLD